MPLGLLTAEGDGTMMPEGYHCRHILSSTPAPSLQTPTHCLTI